MALIVIAVISFLILEAESQNFAKVACHQSEMVAQYGSSTLLDCVFQTSQTDPKIEIVNWILNEKLVLAFTYGEFKHNDSNFQLALGSHWSVSNMNVSLLITNTSLSHAGEYVCAVHTDKGAADSKVHLEVKSKYSKPTIDSDPKKITPDKNFTLTCEAHSGFPEGDIRWVVDGEEWKKPVEVKQSSNGLYDLTSKLSFGPTSPFPEFVCEVYNAKGVKEGQQTFHKTSMDEIAGSGTEGHAVSRAVAPVLLIGLLIMGLFAAVWLRRRRRQNQCFPTRGTGTAGGTRALCIRFDNDRRPDEEAGPMD